MITVVNGEGIELTMLLPLTTSFWDIVIFIQEQLQNVLDAMEERKVNSDETVIQQGDDGDNFYIIERFVRNISSEIYDLLSLVQNSSLYKDPLSIAEIINEKILPDNWI